MIILKFPFKLISKDNEKIMNKQGRYFLSKKYKQFDNIVRTIASAQYKGELLECNLSVSITANFTKRVHADCFNLPKGICDSLQGIIYKNDRQIKEGFIKIYYDKEIGDMFEVSIIEKRTKRRINAI